MLLRDTFKTAFRGVTINVSRSMLTMLGIIIGVASVVLMSAIGASMKGVILGQISSLGPKSMVIFPGQEGGGPEGVSTGFDSLTFEDLSQLEKLSTVTNFAPVIFYPGKVSYGSQQDKAQTLGVTDMFFNNQSIVADRGRIIDHTDDEGAKAVAVIGPDTAEKLFGSAEPLGKSIKIGDAHFQVVGITKPLGSQFFQNADDRVYVPFSMARNASGQKYLSYVTFETVDQFDVAFQDVKSLLRLRHHINNPKDDPAKDDFVVHSSEEAGAILGGVSLGLTLFITTIAAISLIVGGIGIMNIMLVSVTERTREIGLRKAVGAQNRDILLQFLIEAVILTGLGGCIGMMLGIGLAFIASLFVHPLLSTYAFALSPGALIASLLMAALTGLVFGISPARRASLLHPMEALRYE